VPGDGGGQRVISARLDELELPLVEPFETSFGVERRRRVLLLHLRGARGDEGIGECVAGRDPLYSSESVDTARWMLLHYLLPRLFELDEAAPVAFAHSVGELKGHPMAKATVEMALWDLLARQQGRSLSRALGGRRRRVDVGVSVGIQPNIPALVRRVGRYLETGYRRVKLKVRPGWDEGPIAAVRRAYPDLTLWVDANQAYPPEAGPAIARWAERFHVAQVEQPFSAGRWSAHARLARSGAFRVCLDESVVDVGSLAEGIAQHALTSLNVKPGRVGGLGVSRELEARAARSGIPAWVGGMLETGIGRSHCVALASRPGFTLPADLSASDRYFDPDLIDPPFVLGPGSTLTVPDGPGIGVRLVEERVRRYAVRSRTLTPRGGGPRGPRERDGRILRNAP